MQQLKTAPQLTVTQQKALEQKVTVSDKIRYLDKEGITRADIARILNKRYQHVRNVLVQDKLSKQ